ALRSTLPSHLQFGAAPRGAASLHVDVSLGPIELDRAVVGVEQLLHAYEDRRRVANPDLRRLEALLDHANRDLRDAEREVRQRQQEYDRGRKELPPDDPQLKRLA